MNKVLLVNRYFNGSHQQYPVSGKSGKFYGTSIFDASKGGLVFELSPEDYERDKFDIVGNPAPGQQWVPEFSLNGVVENDLPDFSRDGHQIQLKEHELLIDGLRITYDFFDFFNKPNPDQWFRVLERTEDGSVSIESRLNPPTDSRKFLEGLSMPVLRVVAKHAGLTLHNPNRVQLVEAILENAGGAQ